MKFNRNQIWLTLLNQAPAFLLLVVLAVFGSLSPKFLELQNFVNILIQASSIAVAATGMTLVLLTAGVDLSVGSMMFLSVAIAGKMISSGQPIWMSLLAALLVGLIGGGINALWISRCGVQPFIATLAMLFGARGLGLWLTNTRAMNMPDAVTHLGAMRVGGVPLPILVMLIVAGLLHWLLVNTQWGRQLYAVGENRMAARKAGVRVEPILLSAYVICGGCAALSGLIALSQTGAVSPSFGQQREFAAIAAAVLGGTSLFGGRGSILPGTLLGALLFQTVENGLVILNADPYLYPLLLSAIIFMAVLLDSTRQRVIARVSRRLIRPL
jgi:ribose transport system permease protein